MKINSIIQFILINICLKIINLGNISICKIYCIRDKKHKSVCLTFAFCLLKYIYFFFFFEKYRIVSINILKKYVIKYKKNM